MKQATKILLFVLLGKHLALWPSFASACSLELQRRASIPPTRLIIDDSNTGSFVDGVTTTRGNRRICLQFADQRLVPGVVRQRRNQELWISYRFLVLHAHRKSRFSLKRKLRRAATKVKAACEAFTALPQPSPSPLPPNLIWEILPSLPVARQEVGVGLTEGNIYVVGGILTDRSATGRVDRFEISTGNWSSFPPLPGGATLHHVAVAVVGDRLFAIGGLDQNFQGVQTVFELDSETPGWIRRADLPRARGSVSAATANGNIFAAGGEGGSNVGSAFSVYDPTTDRWTPLPNLLIPRTHAAAAAKNGVFYLIGGRNGGLRDVLNSVEAYEVASGQWHSLEALPTARAGIAAALLQNRIYVFGGEGNADRGDGIFPQVESLDLGQLTWRSHDPMPFPRHGIGAAVHGNSIYIPGGSPRAGFSTTTHHDAFVLQDPET